MRVRVSSILLAFGLGLACEASERDPEAAPCSPGEPARCDDDGKLLECVDELWQGDSCATLCQDIDPELHYGTCRRLIDEPDDCECGRPCEGDATRCTSGFDYDACVDGYWEGASCDEYCAADGRLAIACVYDPGLEAEACACVDASSPCESPTWSHCSTEVSLVSCVDGAWQETDCTADCDAPKEGLCNFDPDAGEATCLCGALPGS